MQPPSSATDTHSEGPMFVPERDLSTALRQRDELVAENAKLKRDASRVPEDPSGRSEGTSRRLSVLRDALTRKEQEILWLKDHQLSRERQLMEARETITALRSEKTRAEASTGASGRAASEYTERIQSLEAALRSAQMEAQRRLAESGIEAIRMERDQLAQHVQEFSRVNAELTTAWHSQTAERGRLMEAWGSDSAMLRAELDRVRTECLTTVDELVRSHEASVGAQSVDHDHKLTALRQEHSRALQSLCSERNAGLAEITTLRTERDAGLAELGSVYTERDTGLAHIEALCAERDTGLAHIEALCAERDTGLAHIEALCAERDTGLAHIEALCAERDTGLAHIEALCAERDTGLAHIEALRSAKDASDAQIATLSAERDAGLAEIATLSAERDAGRADIATLSAERDAGRADIATLSAERDAGRADIATLSAERDAGLAEIATLSAERDAGREEITALSVERDAGLAEIATLSVERDAGLAEIATLSVERDARLAEIATLSVERDAGREEITALSAERDAGLAEIATLSAERDAGREECSALHAGLGQAEARLLDVEALRVEESVAHERAVSAALEQAAESHARALDEVHQANMRATDALRSENRENRGAQVSELEALRSEVEALRARSAELEEARGGAELALGEYATEVALRWSAAEKSLSEIAGYRDRYARKLARAMEELRGLKASAAREAEGYARESSQLAALVGRLTSQLVLEGASSMAEARSGSYPEAHEVDEAISRVAEGLPDPVADALWASRDALLARTRGELAA